MEIWELITLKEIIIALITAATTIIGVVLIEILLGRRTFNLLEKHSEQTTQYKDNLEESHSGLSKENSNLSKEHSSLSKEHLELKMMQSNLKEKQGDIFNMMNQDRNEKINAYEKMTDKQKELNDHFNKFQLFINDWQRQTLIIERLEKDIIQIKELNIDLEEENTDLKDQLKRIKNRNKDFER